MLYITLTASNIREMHRLQKENVNFLHTFDNEYWQRLGDYTQIDPEWLYWNGTKRSSRYSGMEFRTRNCCFLKVRTRAEAYRVTLSN